MTTITSATDRIAAKNRARRAMDRLKGSDLAEPAARQLAIAGNPAAAPFEYWDAVQALEAMAYTIAAPADGTRPPVIIAQVRRVQL